MCFLLSDFVVLALTSYRTTGGYNGDIECFLRALEQTLEGGVTADSSGRSYELYIPFQYENTGISKDIVVLHYRIAINF
jgi:hypothetical protein